VCLGTTSTSPAACPSPPAASSGPRR
jgi:hypothetical protein